MSKNKLIFTLVIVFFIRLNLFADVLLSESFTNSNLPSGWTNTAIEGSQNWIFRNTPVFNSGSSNFYAVFDDFSLGVDVTPNQAALTTPLVNAFKRNIVKLSYYTFWYGVEYTHGYVEISNDGGTNWNIIKEYEISTVGSLSNPVNEILDISSYAANQVNVKVRFRYYDGKQAGRFWYLDDIKIYCEPDVGVSTLIAPVGLNCATSYSASENVTIRVNNYGVEPISNINFTCLISGAINQTLNGTYSNIINGQSFIDYTFPQQVNMSADAAYHFTAYTKLNNDKYVYNDTLIDGRRQKVSAYPYNENFNQSPAGWFAGTSNPSFSTRTFKYGFVPYLNGPAGNAKSWYLTVPVDGSADVWVESPVFNLSGLNNPVLSMDIKYKLTGSNNKVILQYSVNDGVNWITLGNGNEPLWYNSKGYNSWNDNYNNPVTEWTKVQHGLCAINGQSCVKFRISTQSLYYNNDRAWFAFDNFKIEDRPDVGVTAYLEPVNKGCNFSAKQQITVKVFNWGCTEISNIPVYSLIKGKINTTINGIVTGPISSNSSVEYTFPGTIDMTSIGTYNFKTYTKYNGDINLENDTLSTVIQVTQPTITSFLFAENFNSNNGYWTAGSAAADTNRRFIWGEVPYLNGSEGESNSWYLTVPKDGSGDVWAESPVFDLSKQTNPTLSMDIKYKLTGSNNKVVVQYSIDGGVKWTIL
ncbi:MAG: hypothetical protein KA792_11070, partial [Bacteroidales bacterium]|nr:hypothetical protein [Bacteroidales bacterium]